MIRRVRISWPDKRPFAHRGDRPIRFLAASDEVDKGLEYEVNRTALGHLDGVIGCGDLSPEWLAFLADAFGAPLVYVRGNHDRGGGWEEERRLAPKPLDAGKVTHLADIPIAGLAWPGVERIGNERHPGLAWLDALGVARRSLLPRLAGRGQPVVVISHAPPAGAGDAPADPYHQGFGAYRWLLDLLRPPVWLHGHTTTASVPALTIHEGPTTLVNVTGAVLVEIVSACSDGRGGDAVAPRS